MTEGCHNVVFQVRPTSVVASRPNAVLGAGCSAARHPCLPCRTSGRPPRVDSRGERDSNVAKFGVFVTGLVLQVSKDSDGDIDIGVSTADGLSGWYFMGETGTIARTPPLSLLSLLSPLSPLSQHLTFPPALVQALPASRAGLSTSQTLLSAPSPHTVSAAQSPARPPGAHHLLAAWPGA